MSSTDPFQSTSSPSGHKPDAAVEGHLKRQAVMAYLANRKLMDEEGVQRLSARQQALCSALVTVCAGHRSSASEQAATLLLSAASVGLEAVREAAVDTLLSACPPIAMAYNAAGLVNKVLEDAGYDSLVSSSPEPAHAPGARNSDEVLEEARLNVSRARALDQKREWVLVFSTTGEASSFFAADNQAALEVLQGTALPMARIRASHDGVKAALFQGKEPLMLPEGSNILSWNREGMRSDTTGLPALRRAEPNISVPNHSSSPALADGPLTYGPGLGRRDPYAGVRGAPSLGTVSGALVGSEAGPDGRRYGILRTDEGRDLAFTASGAPSREVAGQPDGARLTLLGYQRDGLRSFVVNAVRAEPARRAEASLDIAR